MEVTTSGAPSPPAFPTSQGAVGLVRRPQGVPQGVPTPATLHPADSHLGDIPLVIATTSVEESLPDELPVSEKLLWPTNQIMICKGSPHNSCLSFQTWES